MIHGVLWVIPSQQVPLARISVCVVVLHRTVFSVCVVLPLDYPVGVIGATRGSEKRSSGIKHQTRVMR